MLYYLGLRKYTFAQRRISQNVSTSLSDTYLPLQNVFTVCSLSLSLSLSLSIYIYIYIYIILLQNEMKSFWTPASICLAAEVFVLKLLNLLGFIPNR
jgi:hypothetical protein